MNRRRGCEERRERQKLEKKIVKKPREDSTWRVYSEQSIISVALKMSIYLLISYIKFSLRYNVG